MTRVLRCRETGLDCDHVITGSDEEDVVEKTTEHVRRDHGIRELPEELVERVRHVIRQA